MYCLLIAVIVFICRKKVKFPTSNFQLPTSNFELTTRCYCPHPLKGSYSTALLILLHHSYHFFEFSYADPSLIHVWPCTIFASIP